MKKLLAIALCLAICWVSIGCQNEDQRSQNETATEVLHKVLNQEQNFIFKSLVFDQVTEENLEKFSFSTAADAMHAFVPQGYTCVDLDSDGIEEMVIFSATLDYFLILRYDAERVYGYIVPQRSLIDLKTDGSFMTSSGAGINSISRISFANASLEIEDIAYQDDVNHEYVLDGQAATKEAIADYFASWQETTGAVSWENLD